MKWLIPRTIAGRTVLVLVVGLTLSHLVSMAVHYSVGTDAYASLEARRMAERMATITRLVEGAAPDDRARILGALSDPGLRVAWGRDSAVAGDVGGGGTLTEHMLRSQLGPRRQGRVRVAHGAAAGPGPAMMGEHMRTMAMGGAMPGHMRASVELADASWLNFAAPVGAPAQFLSLRVILSLSVMVLAVIALSVWAVRRMTAPLATFASAAERLGRDVAAPRLPETGPHEVRQAIRAFNEMQRRIRRFVEDRTQLVAAIAHDLRTPITRLRLHAEFVEDEDQRRKMLADLEEMEQMIASTLGFARDDAASEPRETVDLMTLLQSVRDDMTDAGQPVEFQAEGRLTYECRRIALRRAFNNLIENAVKYGDRARISLEVREHLVVIRIDDDGPGIPEHWLEDAFKPFHRLEGSRNRDTGGTGLGLTVARTIVRGHGGDIALSNRAEGGLRVEVTLPR